MVWKVYNKHFERTCLFGILQGEPQELWVITLSNNAKILRYYKIFVNIICHKILIYLKSYEKIYNDFLLLEIEVKYIQIFKKTSIGWLLEAFFKFIL